MTKFISDREIYEQVIRDAVPTAKERLWIATADIKDMYVAPLSLHGLENPCPGDVPTPPHGLENPCPGSRRVAATKGEDLVPFLKVIAQLIGKGVEVRLIHAKEPGPNFRADFDRYPRLAKGLERVLCPRVHFKCVIVDGTLAWFGSANLTGAGMGAKSEQKRNFENGVLTDERSLIAPLEEQFDAVWRGDFCRLCGRKDFCPDPILTDDQMEDD